MKITNGGKILVLSLTILITGFYLITAFITESIDFRDWNQYYRVIYVVVTFTASIAVIKGNVTLEE